MRRLLLGLLLPATGLIAWALAATAGMVPSLLDAAGAGVELAVAPDIPAALAASVGRAARGFAIGALAGTLLGMLAGRWPEASAVLGPTMRVLRAIPAVAWLPVLLLVLGVGEVAAVAVIALAVGLPVFAAAAASGGEVAAVLAGLRGGLAQSWLILVAAEVVTSANGIGGLLVASSGTGRVDRMIALVALIAALALTTDLVLGAAERGVRRVTSRPASLVLNTDHL